MGDEGFQVRAASVTGTKLLDLKLVSAPRATGAYGGFKGWQS